MFYLPFFRENILICQQLDCGSQAIIDAELFPAMLGLLASSAPGAVPVPDAAPAPDMGTVKRNVSYAVAYAAAYASKEQVNILWNQLSVLVFHLFLASSAKIYFGSLNEPNKLVG